MSMAAGPLVSVVIPSYNHASYLERCIDSVFMQSYQNIELIVIDDGSTDDSLTTLRRLAKHAPFVMTVQAQQNKGAAFTINRGIELSTGKYINLLNSDDAFMTERIATLLGCIQGTGPEFIFSGVRFVNDFDDEVSNVDEYAIDLVAKQSAIKDFITIGFSLIRSNVAISTGNFFFSRELVQRVGLFADLKYCHDWDFLLRSLIHVEPIYLAERLYSYRLHSHNSFRNLGQVAGHEGPALMRDYFHRVRTGIVPNMLAPCYQNWGEYFWSFITEIEYWPYLNSHEQE